MNCCGPLHAEYNLSNSPANIMICNIILMQTWWSEMLKGLTSTSVWKNFSTSNWFTIRQFCTFKIICRGTKVICRGAVKRSENKLKIRDCQRHLIEDRLKNFSIQIFYTSTASTASDKYHVWSGVLDNSDLMMQLLTIISLSSNINMYVRSQLNMFLSSAGSTWRQAGSLPSARYPSMPRWWLMATWWYTWSLIMTVIYKFSILQWSFLGILSFLWAI